MTRISSLFVAATVAILPISAFAQQTIEPGKTSAPAGMTTATPAATAPVTGKTAGTMSEGKGQDVKTVNSHHAKASVPAKTAEPGKS